MEDVIEGVRAYIWAAVRNLKTIKERSSHNNKPVLCRLGLHKMKRGFGWSYEYRHDICTCIGCNFKAIHKDEVGFELLLKTREQLNTENDAND